MRFNVYRTNCRGVSGLVDYLGEVNVKSDTIIAAELKARELFDFDYGAGERCDVARVCTTCDGMGRVVDEMESREVKCGDCDGSGEI